MNSVPMLNEDRVFVFRESAQMTGAGTLCDWFIFGVGWSLFEVFPSRVRDGGLIFCLTKINQCIVH